ncbi:MAG: hypothetical protein MUQ30_18670 [Anaerolineae bacterium]|nr:hypothetical protein [Anaerolineae bacterium]
MRFGRLQCYLLMMGLALAALAANTAPIRAQEAGVDVQQTAEDEQQTFEDARLILAFYNAWFDWSTWASPACDHPTSLYVSADVAAVERHIQEAQSVGIDAFVQAWYGPALAGNPTESNLEMLLQQADRYGFNVAVMVDMTGEFMQTTGDIADALATIQEAHAAHPAYLRYEGRPVVFFLGQNVFSLPAWEALRNRVDPAGDMLWIAQGSSAECLSVFDGLYLYDVGDGVLSGADMARWAGEVRQWNQDHATAHLWVATVLPGYDDSRLVDEDEAVVRSRRGGGTYRDSWATAANSDPDWIAIRSYNEWTHCSHIEPSVEYGRTYLQLTSELAEQYRYPATPIPLPTATPVPASPTPTETPVTAPGAPELGPTATVTPTAALTPTSTITPTATPFRLSTPTPTLAAGQTQPDEPALTPDLERPADSAASQRPVHTATPPAIPRLPVEGSTPRRCSLLPALLPLVAAVAVRRRRL